MVYKYYIKRGNKKFGPYYYRSYRVGNKVKKEYLGTDNEKRFSKAIPWRIILLPIRKIKPNGTKIS
jgi:hypothetical protein